MRKFLLILVAATGCAQQAGVIARPVPRPAIDSPELWINPPPRTMYRYVGRVQGATRATDFVEAARTAEDDLRWKAHEMGADIVRIDYLAVPPEHAHARRRVLIAGAAYKAIPHR